MSGERSATIVLEDATMRQPAAVTPAAPISAMRSRKTKASSDGRLLLRLILPAGFLLVWSGTSAAFPEISSVLPGPVSVLVRLFKEAASGALALHILASLERAIGGFLLAAVFGIVLGLAMSQSPPLRYLLGGPVELLRPISSVAWIPLAILWFGLGYRSVIFVIAVSCVFIVLVNTLGAALRVDRDLLKAARTLGANRWLLFRKVVVPSALPGIMLGLRIALAGAWGGVLVAEMIATQQGLGYMIVRAQASFQPDLVIGGMVVIGLVGYLLNALFVRLERKVIHV